MSNTCKNPSEMIPQDLHIHTVFSSGDSAVVKEQTIDLIRQVRHAGIIGISDHFEYLVNGSTFDAYEKEVRSAGFKLGTEISGHTLVHEAVRTSCDYFVYHCSREEDYRALDRLLETGRPVIIAHPLIMGTNINRIPCEAYIEINNRYIWRSNWRKGLRRFVNRCKFVIGSDAHQPSLLNQNVARHVCRELGIRETILFTDYNQKPQLRTQSNPDIST
jgi:histidinol phosphatase-like PHP family hydrolase